VNIVKGAIFRGGRGFRPHHFISSAVPSFTGRFFSATAFRRWRIHSLTIASGASELRRLAPTSHGGTNIFSTANSMHRKLTALLSPLLSSFFRATAGPRRDLARIKSHALLS
jgi:hypothetical protein